jgi:hypothetical protein
MRDPVRDREKRGDLEVRTLRLAYQTAADRARAD